jgi:hypothetical protein
MPYALRDFLMAIQEELEKEVTRLGLPLHNALKASTSRRMLPCKT